MTVQTRFIPFRKRDILEMLSLEERLKTDEDKHDFEMLCRIVESIFHFEFHEKLEHLKDTYFPMNPDLTKWRKFTADELERSGNALFLALREILNHANFDRISEAEILEAYEENAVLKATVKVDMDDYDTVEFYCRGRRKEKAELRYLFGLRKKVIEFDVLERVVLLVRFKSAAHFKDRKRSKLPFEPGSTLIKLFKDVPKADLEILFPNSKVTMNLKDKLLLFVPAVVGGIPLMISKVLPAVIVIAILASAYFGTGGHVEQNELKKTIAAVSALVALGGFCLKQWMKYKNKKYEFQKELSDNLYFRNLVNNAGVFHSLVDSAEEEECKEAFLAYYFLHTSEEDLTELELDRLVEKWFKDNHGCTLDFECDDALGKLERLKLLEKRDDGVLKVPEFKEALRRLDETWDNYFQFHGQ